MILTVNLNAAVDRTLIVEGFAVDRVHRVKEVRSVPGGKGANVAKIAALLDRRVTATGFAGGATGDFIARGLAERGVTPDFVAIDGESRVCYAVVDPQGGTITELLEPGPVITPKQWAKFRERFASLASTAGVVTLSGSLPRGLPADAYAQLIRLAREGGVRVILDSSGEALRHGLQARPYMVKPNQEELESLLGFPLDSPEACVQAGRELQSQGVGLAVISLGERGAVVVDRDSAWQATPPRVPVQNTVGCGDALVAGLAVGLAEDLPVVEMARLATAAAAAKAERSVPGELDPAEMQRLLPLVAVRQLPPT